MSVSAISGGPSSSASLSAFQNKLFSNIDTNGDGQISPDELAAFGQNLPGTDGTSGDSSQDLFNQIDTNGDGSISQEELQAYNQQQSQGLSALLQLQELAGAEKSQGHHHHHHTSSGSGQAQSIEPTTEFNQLDTNQDGSISASEWAAAFGTSSPANASASGQSASNSVTDSLLQTLNTLV